MDHDRGFWTAFSVVGTVAALIISIIALVAATDDESPSAPDTPTKTTVTEAPKPKEPKAETSKVEATLTEFAVALAPAEVPAGEVALAIQNDGEAAHTLVLEGTDTKQGELAAGESGKLDLGKLKPGDYVLFCDIPGHRPAGMEATLTVG